MDIGRDERRVRRFPRKVWTFSEAEQHGEIKGPERKQIRENAVEEREAEGPPVLASEG
jgi:mannose/cellobiose epimerase-like protein (N-acyl-D-glucosamine 2-epimerase family)